MTPKPSHPSRINMRFGIEISISIEMIKNITSRVKRGRNGSELI